MSPRFQTSSKRKAEKFFPRARNQVEVIPILEGFNAEKNENLKNMDEEEKSSSGDLVLKEVENERRLGRFVWRLKGTVRQNTESIEVK